MRLCLAMSRFGFGISKFDAQKNYYKILGVGEKVSNQEVKKAFRKLAKQHHPDSENGNEEKFKEINEAYQVLSDESIKKEYDISRSEPQVHQENRGFNDNNYRGYEY